MRDYKENSLSARVRKDVVFVLFTILLVMILVLFISETVMSQTENGMQVDEAYYMELEAQYLQEIRVYLQREGFENSGVTFTRVVDNDGSRYYDVRLHHKRIEKLDAESQNDLLKEIEKLAFDMPGCSFNIHL